MEDLESPMKGFRCSFGIHSGLGIEHGDTECVWGKISLVDELLKGGSCRETNNGLFLLVFSIHDFLLNF